MNLRFTLRRCALGSLVAAIALIGAGCVATEDNPGGGIVLNDSGYMNANTVLDKLVDGGWPVGEGYPSSPQFASLKGRTRCSSSKTFVRTDSDRGWGFICVGMPNDLYVSIKGTFEDSLVIMAPLYLDSEGGQLVVFGFGWPGDTSQRFAETLDANGTYLLPPG